MNICPSPYIFPLFVRISTEFSRVDTSLTSVIGLPLTPSTATGVLAVAPVVCAPSWFSVLSPQA